KLAAGQSMLLSVENLSAGDGVKHLQVIFGWEHPSLLAQWKGRQFIGRPEDPPGGRYRIEVFVAPLAELRQLPLDRPGPPDLGVVVPRHAVVMAGLTVTRAATPPPAPC